MSGERAHGLYNRRARRLAPRHAPGDAINAADPGLSRAAVTRASALAEELRHECGVLLELYTNRESFTADMADSRLVSVPPPSSLLDARDELWRLQSALLQCRSLLDSAVALEEEELGGGKEGDYVIYRKIVKDTLSRLLIATEELLRAAGGAALPTPGAEGLKYDGSAGLFQLKLWVYRIFKELEYWTKTAITTLQALPSVSAKKRGSGAQGRRARRVRQ
ncbi:uncharacterized protein AB9W97_015313 isoform 2-T2 [Spinachia spinachia]